MITTIATILCDFLHDSADEKKSKSQREIDFMLKNNGSKKH